MINKFINYINNMNVVGAVLIKDNKIILPKRSDTLLKYPGFYEFSIAATTFAQNVDNPSRDCLECSQTIQGGALRTYPFDPLVDSV